jgi:succinate dehydrogenase / fumarate reductase cytochrome b subunit
MDSAPGFARSSIGRKVIMASTGVILVAYVIAHMLGNLQVYMGPEGINAYGKFLHTFLHGGGIWIARAVLLAAVLLHIIYHILHFTTGTAHPDFIPGDVYHNFVAGFRVVPVSIVYIVAMIALGLHLRHGVWSMFQTLGVSHPRYMRAAHVLAWIVAIAVTAGNISFPLAVLAGVVK